LGLEQVLEHSHSRWQNRNRDHLDDHEVCLANHELVACNHNRRRLELRNHKNLQQRERLLELVHNHTYRQALTTTRRRSFRTNVLEFRHRNRHKYLLHTRTMA
jgi:hypothetical protein